MATHSSILAWRIPWTEEPGGLQYMGSKRVRHNCVTNTSRMDHNTGVLSTWCHSILAFDDSCHHQITLMYVVIKVPIVAFFSQETCSHHEPAFVGALKFLSTMLNKGRDLSQFATLEPFDMHRAGRAPWMDSILILFKPLCSLSLS